MSGRNLVSSLVLVAALAGVITLATLVGIWVVGVAIALLAWWACIHVAYSRTTLRTIVRIDDKEGHSSLEVLTWKYPEWRNLALVGMILIPLFTAAAPLVILVNKGNDTPSAETQATPIPTATQSKLSPTPTREPPSATPNLTPTPTAVPPTLTPSLVPTLPSPTMAALTETPGWTPTEPSPPLEAPERTSTATPSPTPNPTATAPPPTATHTAAPTLPAPSETPAPLVVQPEQLAPLHGREYKNPVTFQWTGTLNFGQTYRVTAYHVLSGDHVQSILLTDPEWTVDLPAVRFGEWRWQVAVISLERTVATSTEWMFWFNPLPGTRRVTVTPTATPTRVRKP